MGRVERKPRPAFSFRRNLSTQAPNPAQSLLAKRMDTGLIEGASFGQAWLVALGFFMVPFAAGVTISLLVESAAAPHGETPLYRSIVAGLGGLTLALVLYVTYSRPPLQMEYALVAGGLSAAAGSLCLLLAESFKARLTYRSIRDRSRAHRARLKARDLPARRRIAISPIGIPPRGNPET